MSSASPTTILAQHIKTWGHQLGFQQVGITDPDLMVAEQRWQTWLQQHYHGEMAYMANHGYMRSRPELLLPGTKSIIVGRMDYLPPAVDNLQRLEEPDQAVIAAYALGRDYHKLIRKRLQQLIHHIQQHVGDCSARAFADSAPILEKPLAEKAGLGWIGKHTNLINARSGSWFFLGVIYTDLALPFDKPSGGHCGRCTACLDICPTQAIVAPYQLDASRCISYLTIELRGSIPVAFRPLIGNRIYGCDDCQAICPWNRFATFTGETDFHPRQALHHQQLLTLFAWSEAQFLEYTAGSAIRRIGYACWLRNIAVALGNAPHQHTIVTALQQRLNHPSLLVREHVQWALDEQSKKITAHT